MEQRKVGSGQLELPVVTFGAWAIGGMYWGGGDDEASIQAIHAAIDHGVDAIDTAPAYGNGHSETLIGKAIKGRRDQVKILTKCGLRWDTTDGEYFFDMKAPDGSEFTIYKNTKADSIAYECEQSLKRMGIDTIDLLQVHWPSESAPIEETIGGLTKLKAQGKIREFGVSNYTGRQLADAAALGPVVSNQIKYNLLERDIEADPLPTCRDKNIGVIVYSPMAMGLLTGKVTMDRKFPDTDFRSTKEWFRPPNRKRAIDAVEKIRPIADAHGVPLAQLSVAWVLAQPGITTALVGARNAEQAAENAAAGDIKLTQDELDTMRKAFEEIGAPAE